jgi:hypothetical protein
MVIMQIKTNSQLLAQLVGDNEYVLLDFDLNHEKTIVTIENCELEQAQTFANSAKGKMIAQLFKLYV